MVAGIESTTQDQSGYSGAPNVDSLHNNWTNITVIPPQIGANVDGIFLTGAPAGNSDTDGNTWNNVQVSPSGNVGYSTCFHIQVADGNTLINIQCSNAGIVFDYTANNAYPGGTFIFGIDSLFSSTGVIAGPFAPHRVYALGTGNGHTCPTNIANLFCDDRQWISTAGCTTAASSLATCTTTVTWLKAYPNGNYWPQCQITATNHPMMLGDITTSGPSIVVDQVALTAAASSGTLVCSAWSP
jgi:hypothetical protein